VLRGDSQVFGVVFDHPEVDVLSSEDDVDAESGGQLIGDRGQLEGVGATQVGLRIDDEERRLDNPRGGLLVHGILPWPTRIHSL